MPGVPALLGPFIGGLNTVADPAYIADDELARCDNFDIDVDGTLKARPPCDRIVSTGIVTDTVLLGWYTTNTGASYLIGDSYMGLVYWNGTDWNSFGPLFARFAAMVQYQNKVWFIPKPDSSNSGGNWDGTTWTTVASIPKGEAAAVHKERLWIAPGRRTVTNGSRIRFSKPGDFTTWDAADFLDINSGDGQNVIDLISYQGNIVVFKSDSTYVFSYESDPARGTVNLVSNTVGCTDRDCVETYENSIFVLHENNVYELANYTYTKLNVKIKLIAEYYSGDTITWPLSLSVMGDRLLVRYYRYIYVLNLKNGAWSRWTTHPVGKLWRRPVDPVNPVNNYYGFDITADTANLWWIQDNTETTNTEYSTAFRTFRCVLRTKTYDFGAGHIFKRLFWWGVDCIANTEILGEMTPVVQSAELNWSALSGNTWNSLLQNTWTQPLLPNISVETYYPTPGAVGIRKFVKFLRSARFRQVYFDVDIETSGAVNEPVQVNSITALVSNKATVTQAVN